MRNLGIIVDECDRHLVKAYSWHLQRKTGARRYIATTAPGKKTIYLHRVIMDAAPGDSVDHINGDPLDNRRANLRVVSHLENTQHRPNANRNNTSGARGVTFHKELGRWVAQVNWNRNGSRGHVYLGVFDTVEEAARASEAWRLRNMPGYIPEVPA
jgi:hypothetical protein